MITPLSFTPARREEVPDYVRAAALQGQGELAAREFNDQMKRDRNALPGELYGAYSEITGTNPIADAISRNRGSSNGMALQGPTPTGADPLASAPVAGASKITPVMSGGSAASTAGSAAVPVVGGALSAALSRQQGGSQRDQIKSGVGTAAAGTLATYGTPMAASGPAGWIGIAALAAASLYGMLA